MIGFAIRDVITNLDTMNDNFFLAYSSLSGAYGIFLKKYNSEGQEQWNSPVNLIEGVFEDNLVKAMIPNPDYNSLIVIFESASFMGVGLNVIFIISSLKTISHGIFILFNFDDNRE